MGGRKYLTREQILAAPDVGLPNPAEVRKLTLAIGHWARQITAPVERFALRMRELLTRVAAQLNPEKKHPSLGDDVFLIYAAAKGYRARNPVAVE